MQVEVVGGAERPAALYDRGNLLSLQEHGHVFTTLMCEFAPVWSGVALVGVLQSYDHPVCRLQELLCSGCFNERGMAQ